MGRPGGNLGRGPSGDRGGGKKRGGPRAHPISMKKPGRGGFFGAKGPPPTPFIPGKTKKTPSQKNGGVRAGGATRPDPSDRGPPPAGGKKTGPPVYRRFFLTVTPNKGGREPPRGLSK